MSELWEDALHDYESGMKYKEIANKYGVSLNTVKSWKTRHWNNAKGVHTKEKCAHKKRGAQPGNKNSKGGPEVHNQETKTAKADRLAIRKPRSTDFSPSGSRMRSIRSSVRCQKVH